MRIRHGQRTKLGLLILLGSTLGACLKPEKFPDGWEANSLVLEHLAGFKVL